METIIGVDLGGTLVRAARFTPDLELLERTEQPIRAGEGSAAVIERLIETIQQVLPKPPQQWAAIGLGVPGPLDPTRGVIIKAANLPFEDTPIVRIVQEALGGAVFAGNDADLAALAEYHLGAGRGTHSMIYMTISTGIGGGLVLNGDLYTGQGQAGEVGHMVVEPEGPLCGCGRRGHLEALASGRAIARIARERLEAGEPSLLREWVGENLTQIDAKLVGQAARQGDALALSIVQQAGHYIGIAIASLAMLLNPDRFVLGGGVTRLDDLLFEPMKEAMREYVLHPRYWERTPIVPAELGEDVGLYGAAALARARLGTHTP